MRARASRCLPRPRAIDPKTAAAVEVIQAALERLADYERGKR